MFGYTPTPTGFPASGATTAAAAAMAALSCGMSPTDPRLQPFLKSAREDHVLLHMRVLMSNGVPEAIARAQAELAAGDRTQFFGQAVLKYFASLTPGGTVTAVPPPPPPVPTPAAMEPPPPPPPPDAGAAESAVYRKDGGTDVAKVIATVQFNINRAKRSSRFDVSTTTTAATPPQPPVSSSILGPAMFVPAQLPTPASVGGWPAVALDRALQQWTYRVFSALQTAPVGVDVKQWRAKISAFVNTHAAQVRDVCGSGRYPLPSWLTSCTIPSISEVLGHVPDSFTVPTSFPAGGLSPVSSSSASSSDNVMVMSSALKRRRRADIRTPVGDEAGSSSSSAMSASSSSPSPEPNRIDRRGAGGKKAALAARFVKQHKLLGKGKNAKRAVTFATGDVGFADARTLMTLLTAEELRKRSDRLRRFGGDGDETESDAGGGGLKPGLTWEEKLALLTATERVVGTSTALEKPYLRLCGPPDPGAVRPEHVLRKSFDHCMAKWEKERNYRFIEEQFRSIRQDLTVQGIRNPFTVHVYEENARVALQNADLGQFNQCQTQLRELHRSVEGVSEENRIEFLCYRILYLALTNMRQDVLKLLSELSDSDRTRPPIDLAFRFRKALTEGNFHRVLQMCTTGPHMAPYLIRIFLGRIRMTYLHLISRSHYTAAVAFLTKELKFDSEAACRAFLVEHKAIWADGFQRQAIDCRRSAPVFEASPLLQTRKVNALG